MRAPGISSSGSYAQPRTQSSGGRSSGPCLSSGSGLKPTLQRHTIHTYIYIYIYTCIHYIYTKNKPTLHPFGFITTLSVIYIYICIYIYMYTYLYLYADLCVNKCEGCMEGWMDGWMGGWRDGRKDGWMDGCTCTYTYHMYIHIHTSIDICIDKKSCTYVAA